MRKHTLADGSKGRLAEAQDAVELLDRQRVVTRCAACRMTHRGSAVEGREWHRAHRRERHPELAATAGGRRTSSQAQRTKAVADSKWKRDRYAKEGS